MNCFWENYLKNEWTFVGHFSCDVTYSRDRMAQTAGLFDAHLCMRWMFAHVMNNCSFRWFVYMVLCFLLFIIMFSWSSYVFIYFFSWGVVERSEPFIEFAWRSGSNICTAIYHYCALRGLGIETAGDFDWLYSFCSVGILITICCPMWGFFMQLHCVGSLTKYTALESGFLFNIFW